MSNQQLKKEQSAKAALPYVKDGCCLGVGTGSTVNYFIEMLAGLSGIRQKIDRVVASSEDSARRLEQAGFRCSDLNSVGTLDVYVDGADEVDDYHRMIKGGGGAHTREKLLAVNARQFVAIVDDSKAVGRLGRFPLAVEVLPMARAYVARQLAAMGGQVAWREGFVTDSGNWILDVSLLDLTDAVAMENRINAIVGVVENGLFAVRPADIVIVAGQDGVQIKTTAKNIAGQ